MALSAIRMLPETIAKRFCVVAIGEEDEKVIVAMADPLNVIEIDTISLKMNRHVQVFISSEMSLGFGRLSIWMGFI